MRLLLRDPVGDPKNTNRRVEQNLYVYRARYINRDLRYLPCTTVLLLLLLLLLEPLNIIQK